jgi:hypothetical protein
MAKFVRVRTKLVVMSGGCRRVDIVSGCKLDVDLCAHVDMSLWTSCPDVNLCTKLMSGMSGKVEISTWGGAENTFTSVRFFRKLLLPRNMGGKFGANSVPPPFYF